MGGVDLVAPGYRFTIDGFPYRLPGKYVRILKYAAAAIAACLPAGAAFAAWELNMPIGVTELSREIHAASETAGEPIWRRAIGLDTPFFPKPVNTQTPGVLVFDTNRKEVYLEAKDPRCFYAPKGWHPWSILPLDGALLPPASVPRVPSPRRGAVTRG